MFCYLESLPSSNSAGCFNSAQSFVSKQNFFSVEWSMYSINICRHPLFEGLWRVYNENDSTGFVEWIFDDSNTLASLLKILGLAISKHYICAYIFSVILKKGLNGVGLYIMIWQSLFTNLSLGNMKLWNTDSTVW